VKVCTKLKSPSHHKLFRAKASELFHWTFATRVLALLFAFQLVTNKFHWTHVQSSDPANKPATSDAPSFIDVIDVLRSHRIISCLPPRYLFTPECVECKV
jgi:hypothetical protein